MHESFLCIDPIEDYLHKLTIDMTEWEWISYLQHAVKALYGVELIAEGHQERAIFKWLRKTYGSEHAGLIIKWVVFKYHCRDAGSIIRFTSFSKGRKWWVDLMHAEMQEQLIKEERATAATPADTAMISSAKFL